METVPKPVSIIIADNHIRMANGLKSCLRGPEYCIKCVQNTEDLYTLKGNNYHLLLFQYKLPDFNYTDQKWKKRFPGLKFIAYTPWPNWMVNELVKSKQLNGYITDNSTKSEIDKCITSALKNQYYVADDIERYLITTPQPPALFTNENEMELYKCISSCGRTKKLVTTGKIPKSTAYTSRDRIYEKTGAADDFEIILHALRQHWIFIEDISF